MRGASTTAQPEPDDNRWWVLSTIGIGTFMSALDGSVVNTVLPLLRRDLGATVAAIEWVTVVYLLVVSALLLGFGRAGDIYGHRRMYLGGFVLFVAASALCGFSSSAIQLVVLRGLQGTGAAMLFANAPAILTKSFPPHQRGRALGAQGTFTYLGLTAGPSIGGWLATAYGWRWVFFINVPVGIVAILLALRFIENDRPEGAVERFDFLGATLFTSGLVSLLIALNRGHSWGWSAVPTLSLLTIAIALLVAFVVVERRGATPMLDLSLFRSRVFSAAASSALLNYTCLYCVIFVLPFLLIQGRGLTAGQAGILLTAQPIVMAIVAPLSGAMSDRIGSRSLAVAGMLILSIGLLLLVMSLARDLALIAGSLAVVGLGVGIFVSPNNSALMGAAPRQRQGIAAGVLATCRNLGMVLGVGISGALFTTYLAHGGENALQRGVAVSLTVAAAIAAAGAMTAALMKNQRVCKP